MAAVQQVALSQYQRILGDPRIDGDYADPVVCLGYGLYEGFLGDPKP